MYLTVRIYPFLAKSSTTVSLELFALYYARLKIFNGSSATQSAINLKEYNRYA